MTRNPTLRTTVALLAAATITTLLAVLIGTLLAAPAHAVQVEPADRHVKPARLALTYAEAWPNGRLYVELNNGATYHVPPCRTEDSRHCWWNATKQGDRTGTSFVRVARHKFTLGGIR